MTGVQTPHILLHLLQNAESTAIDSKPLDHFPGTRKSGEREFGQKCSPNRCFCRKKLRKFLKLSTIYLMPGPVSACEGSRQLPEFGSSSAYISLSIEMHGVMVHASAWCLLHGSISA